MQFLSLEPFIPSGPDFQKSKELFQALGFTVEWDAGDYVGFANGDCRFILQKFDNRDFAENLMISVKISSAEEFWKGVNDKSLAQRFGVRFAAPVQQAYGIEVNMIDAAGVCWHFVE